MEDYRHRPRKNTPHLVKALDEETGQAVGRVVDITADGLMMVCPEPIPVGRTLRLRIVLPVMVHHRTDVTIDAQTIWSDRDTNPDFYRVGLKFINLPGEDGFLLEDVMHKLNLVG